MKKLLLVGLIVGLGVSTFALDQKQTADVTVKAEVVAENLVIEDLTGRPIVLDFGKVTNVVESRKGAKVDFKIKNVGGIIGTDITLALKEKGAGEASEIELNHTTDSSITPLDATVALNSEIITGGLAQNAEYRGFITGTLVVPQGQEVGAYEHVLELEVTYDDGATAR
ncbi:MAG: hypothetical protein ACRDCE_10565 [Cetobacterium sp.]|uniref:hypothetical protein n=1 Tax=Cetobacterium sp. TaxID=2071632 RepID=UPI003EE6561C